MLLYLIFFFISPLVEWSIHILLHYTNEYIHNNHHIFVASNNFKFTTNILFIETWPIILSLLCIYFKYYFILIGIMRYWIIHTYIHFTNINNYLVNHHFIHHKNKKYNFTISAIWPDILFKTIKTK